MTGLAIVHEDDGLYALCAEKLGSKSLGEWHRARQRTDEKMRQILNLTLHSMIWTCQPELADKTLVWARTNTMNLQVNDQWI